MKPLLNLTFLCVILFSIYSCRKDSSPSSPTGPASVKPDLTVKVTTSVSGYITNEADSPIVFASVSVGNQQATTDQYGYFSVSNVSLPQVAGLVKVLATGYFNGYRTFMPKANKSAFIRIQMLSKKEIGIIDAASGGNASTTEG